MIDVHENKISIRSNPKELYRLECIIASNYSLVPSLFFRSSLLCITHSPKGFQIASFSWGFKLADKPLVLVATNTLAPDHPSSSVLSSPSTSSRPMLCLSSCHPYRNSALLGFFP